MGQITNRDITFNNYFSIILRLKQIGSPEHEPNKIELIWGLLESQFAQPQVQWVLKYWATVHVS